MEREYLHVLKYSNTSLNNERQVPKENLGNKPEWFFLQKWLDHLLLKKNRHKKSYSTKKKKNGVNFVMSFSRWEISKLEN